MIKIKVLLLSANPMGTPALAIDQEVREITQKIRAAEHRDAVELVSRWAVRPDDLLQVLNEHKPNIVHFSGHGSPSDEIILQDNYGNPKPVSTAALESLFRTLKDNIQVVVLNACYSKPQAKAITEIIDCAIGMNSAIGDEAAITFAASFYRAIGFGRSVQEAFEQGKTALRLEGIREDKTPELLVHKGADASQLYLLRAAPGHNEVPDPTGSEQHLNNGSPEVANVQKAAMPGKRSKVFVSYSHKDVAHLDRLKVHLRPLERQLSLDIWVDTKIESGDDWKSKIDEALQTATCAILLISADFLASEFIDRYELPVILKRQKQAGLVVLPVMVATANLDLYPEISRMQMVNTPSKPLVNMPEPSREEIWRDLSKRVAQLATNSPAKDRPQPEATPNKPEQLKTTATPTAEDVHKAAKKRIREQLGRNTHLVSQLLTLFDLPDNTHFEQLIAKISTVGVDSALAEILVWLKQPGASFTGLGNLRSICGDIACLSVNDAWITSRRVLELRGRLVISDVLDDRFADILVASLFGRDPRYRILGSTRFGERQALISRDVAARGMSIDSQLSACRDELIKMLGLNPTDRKVDLQLKQRLESMWQQKDPLYTVFAEDDELLGYLETSNYIWKDAWLMLPKIDDPDYESYSMVNTSGFHLHDIYNRIDELGQSQAEL